MARLVKEGRSRIFESGYAGIKQHGEIVACSMKGQAVLWPSQAGEGMSELDPFFGVPANTTLPYLPFGGELVISGPELVARDPSHVNSSGRPTDTVVID